MQPLPQSFTTRTLEFSLQELLLRPSTSTLQNFDLCSTCSFPLHNTHCLLCSNPLPISLSTPLEPPITPDTKYKRMLTPLPSSHSKTLYIFCLDNSGSVQVTYNCSDPHPTTSHSPSAPHLLPRLKSKTTPGEFNKFVSKFNLDSLIDHQEFLVDLITAGETVNNIIRDVEGQLKSAVTGGNKIGKQRSRKDIIKEIVMDIITTLKGADNCDIIVTFFNNKLKAEGIQDLQLEGFLEGEEETAYQCGRQSATKIKLYSTKQHHEINDLFDHYEAEGGTALGPAIVFCAGLASKLAYPRNQLILITDGTSNIGFGEIESIRKQDEDRAFDTSELYVKIAEKYIIPNRIMVNLMGFSDCEIKMYVINQFMGVVGCIPNLLKIHHSKKELVLRRQEYTETRNKFKNEVINLPKRLFWGTKVVFLCSEESIEMHNIMYDAKGEGRIGFHCGVLMPNGKILLNVRVPKAVENDMEVEIMVIVQTRREGNEIRVKGRRRMEIKGVGGRKKKKYVPMLMRQGEQMEVIKEMEGEESVKREVDSEEIVFHLDSLSLVDEENKKEETSNTNSNNGQKDPEPQPKVEPKNQPQPESKPKPGPQPEPEPQKPRTLKYNTDSHTTTSRRAEHQISSDEESYY